MMDRSIQFLYSAMSLVMLVAAVVGCREQGPSPVAHAERSAPTAAESRYPIGEFAEPLRVSPAAFEFPLPSTPAPSTVNENAPRAADTVVFRPRPHRLPSVQQRDEASSHESGQRSQAFQDDVSIEVGAPVHTIIRLPDLREETPLAEVKMPSGPGDLADAFDLEDDEAAADSHLRHVKALDVPARVVESAPADEVTDAATEDSCGPDTTSTQGARWTSEKIESMWSQQDSLPMVQPLESELAADTAEKEPTVYSIQRLPSVPDEKPVVPQPHAVEALPAPKVETPSVEAVSQPSNANENQFQANQIPRAVDPMRAVSDRAAASIRHAFSLAHRGASYSAQTELTETLRMTAEALDMREGSRRHSDALKSGFKALEEAGEFKQRGLAADLNMSVLVSGHQTPVLKGQDLSGVTPLVGLQKYLTYAQQQLAIAGGGQPTSSVALYGLGRLQAELESDQNESTPSAIVFHQAAVNVDPMNYKSANELGVLLARYGQYDQAYELLAHSVRVCPQPESWRNLAKVHAQLGEHELARKAMHEAQLAARNSNYNAAANSGVRWVQPAVLTGTIGSGEYHPPSANGRPIHNPEPQRQPGSRNVGRQEGDGLMRLIPWIRRGE